MEGNLTDIWLKKDPIRWISGALAGLLAGAVMIVVSIVLMKIVGREPLMAAKVPALPLLGAEALEYGQTRALIVGIIVHELLCLFLGVIYAHFTGTNHLGALFGVGITWGIFGWIFISNLFSPSWRDVFVAGVPSGAAFVAWIVFGIVLTSVAFFDRLLRGSSQGR